MKSKLSRLSPEDQNLILRLCAEQSYQDVVRQLAQPRAAGGLALQTNTAALCRFVQKNRNESLESRLDRLVNDLREQKSGDTAGLSNALERLMQERLFADLVACRDISEFGDEFRFLLRLKRLNIAQRGSASNPANDDPAFLADKLAAFLGRSPISAPVTPSISLDCTSEPRNYDNALNFCYFFFEGTAVNIRPSKKYENAIRHIRYSDRGRFSPCGLQQQPGLSFSGLQQ